MNDRVKGEIQSAAAQLKTSAQSLSKRAEFLETLCKEGFTDDTEALRELLESIDFDADRIAGQTAYMSEELAWQMEEE